jgi:S-DNA-T family DNA segregation ATPase FtsK/SpoIIIE
MAARREGPRPLRRPPKPRPGLARERPLAAVWRRLALEWPWAFAVALVGSGGVLGLALVFPGGAIATPLNVWQGRLLGWTAPLVALWLTAGGIAVLWCHLRPETRLPWRRLVGVTLLSGALPGLAGVATALQPDPLAAARAGFGGGVVGLAVARLLADAFGLVGAGVLLAAVAAAGVLLAAQLPPARLLAGARWIGGVSGRGARAVARLWQRWRARHPAAPAALTPAGGRPGLRHRLAARVFRPRHERAEALPAPASAAPEPPRPRGQRPAPPPDPRPAAPAGSPWRLPPIDVLEAPSSPRVAQIDQRQRARIIEETLESFNIGARVVEINEGPTITQFGVEPAMGVTVNRITARANDLALRLGATSLRIEAPVPGKRVVGIEVPNSASAVVTLREILGTPEFARLKSRLGLALGRDVAGRPVAADLARAPHLLIAGATGSGKSVCINGIIACLLMQCTPDDLQLLLVDPKMVELAPYEGIPHLRLPVVTDMDKVVGVLKWAIQEMERRYALFVTHGVRNLESFNRLVSAPGAAPPAKPLPFLVIVIDELADLMMTAPDDVELSLTRLAQKARATGIHLVVATQRPSVDVVTGLIKANFPTRIAFAVTSQVDSRVILDTTGAEKLLGRGDMLFLPAEAAKPIRVQGNYVSDAEIEALVSYWRQQGQAQYDAAEVAAIEALSAARDDSGEDLVERALEVIREHSRVSVSLLQRRLGIGYPRAARLVDTLVERGLLVAADDGRSWVAAPEAAAADTLS